MAGALLALLGRQEVAQMLHDALVGCRKAADSCIEEIMGIACIEEIMGIV